MRTLTGLELRYLLLFRLIETRVEHGLDGLVAAVEASGFSIRGRPGKVVSDALRWEVRRGRVLRVGRGRYATGRVPRSTENIRRRVAHLLAHGPGAWYFDPAVRRSA